MRRALAIAACSIGCAAGCAVATIPQGAESTLAGVAHENRDDWRSTSEAYVALLARAGDTGEALDTSRLRPPGLDPARIEPVPPADEAWPTANATLEQVIAEFAPLVPRRGTTRPAPERRSEGAKIGAMRLYTSGLARSADGRLAEAAGDFAASAALDPSSPTPLLRLAETQAALGQVGAALSSYEKAVELGSSDPFAMAFLGTQAARRGQTREAAAYLSACLSARPERADPLLDNMALAGAARVFRQLGHSRAAIDATLLGLQLPQRLARPSRLAEEANSLTARAALLMLDAGADALRLGDNGLAEQILARAWSLPGGDRSAATALRVCGALRQGLTHDAAVLLLDDLTAHAGVATSRHLAAVEALAADGEVAGLLSAALGDLLAGTDATPTVRSSIARMRARLSADGRAREALLDHMAESPVDYEALGDLMGLVRGAEERVRLAQLLVRAAPESATVVSGTLARWTPAPASLEAMLGDSPEDRLLACNLGLATGDARSAVESARAGLRRAGVEPPLRDALAEALGSAAALAGDWETVDEALGATTVGEAGATSRAAILRSAQRFREAFEALPAEPPAGAGVERLLRRAEIALSAGEGDEAERSLLAAAALDPYEARVYEGLVALYQAGGLPTAESRLAATLQEMRRRLPSSAMMQWLRAQEWLQRGRADEAEELLAALAEEETRPSGAMGPLVRVWEAQSAAGQTERLERALRWVERVASRPPYAGETIAARGTLLSLLGRHDEAEAHLSAALSERGAPVIARSLESAVARRGDTERAARLALARAGSAPRGIENCIEHAELLLQAGRAGEAAVVIREAVPERASLTTAQRGRLQRVLGQLVAATQSEPSPLPTADALGALEHARDAGMPLEWRLLDSAWRLSAGEPGFGDDVVAGWVEALVGALTSVEEVAALAGRFPWARPVAGRSLDDARAELAYAIAGALVSGDREGAGLLVMRTALRYNPDHAGAANDLGYTLLTTGRDLDEAERLIAHAYEVEPDDANIADSLGWLRYLRGIIDDAVGPNGARVEGAVTLLTRAAALPEGSDSPTILDHLGDALWRAGREADAAEAWGRAASAASERVAEFEIGGGRAPDRLREQAEAIRAKLDAVGRGERPSVEPFLSGG